MCLRECIRAFRLTKLEEKLDKDIDDAHATRQLLFRS